MYVFPSELSNHRSPFDGLTGATVEIETDAPPPLPPVIFTVAIPAAAVTVDIPAPLKSSRVTPVPTVPPAVLIPTPAVVTVFPPILRDVAVITPEALI